MEVIFKINRIDFEKIMQKTKAMFNPSEKSEISKSITTFSPWFILIK